MLNRFISSLVCLGCVFVLPSCGGNLELAVDLRTDLVPGVEFDAVRLTVDGVVQPLVSAPLDATVERGVRVYEAQLGSGRHLVNVTLLDGAEEIVGRNYVIQLERSLIFAAVLTRDCRGVECPGAAGSVTDSECLGGRCVDPACDEPGGPSCPTIEPDCAQDADCESTIACVTPICASGVCLRVSEVGACPAGEYCDPESGCAPIPVSTADAGTLDAGSGDVGVPDAGLPDAGMIDAGCSTATQCDDGIDCTVDACSAGDCTHTNDDAACGTGMCDPAGTGADPSTGCVPEGPCRGRATGFVCRASRGDCDAEETCDGTSIECPDDGFASGTCRASAGPCDVAEACSGTGPDCPTDTFLPSSLTCRPALSANLCDRAEMCTGSSADCPTDTFLPSSTTCRPATDLCDRAEMCPGTGVSCPSDTFLAVGSVCHPMAGPCDVAEVCSGSSRVCPTDVFLGGSTVCRPAPGACDVAESCSGSSAACPTDVVRGLGFSCRPTTGICDPAEVCNGVLATCPADLLSPSTTVCHPPLEPCDTAEMCTGSAALCPGGATDLRRDAMLHPVPMPAAPVLFDLNADGNPELFVQSGTRDVSVWRGTPDGAFTSPTIYTYPTPIFGIALVDLDRDGFFELLVSTRDVVTIRRGTTALSFAATTTDSVPLGGPSGALAVGDFDADGVVDDVVVLTTVEVVSLRGDGLLLSQADKYPLAARTALAVGDVSGDGVPDVVIGGNSVLDTLRGMGAGRFAVNTQAVSAAVQYLVLAPLTCDGRLSAVIDDQAGRVVVMLNMSGSLVAQPGLPAATIAGLGAGDINRDGVADLLTLEPGMGFLVFFGRGNGTWAAGIRFGYSRASRGMVIQDTNRDGLPDVVLGASNGVDVLLQ